MCISYIVDWTTFFIYSKDDFTEMMEQHLAVDYKFKRFSQRTT